MNKKKAIVVGLGVMGRAHSEKITSSDLEMIDLLVACDCDIEKIIEYQAIYPDIPVYLAPKHDVISSKDQARAKSLGIEIVASVAELISLFQIDTLVNATHSDSHVKVLEDALSVVVDEKPLIDMVFQEKPFAMDLQEAQFVAEKIKQNNISVNLNGVLTFSEIWSDFLRETSALKENNFILDSVKCSYGKNRMQDTRPAIGGWVGLEGIHALDISTVGLEDICVVEDKVVAIEGFLAEKANPVTGDGVERYAIEAKIRAREKETGASVVVDLEGSFSYEAQNRYVQYFFKDHFGRKAVAQLEFDIREERKRFDRLLIRIEDEAGLLISELLFESTADKILGYYKASLDSADGRIEYDIDRALNVQAVLDDLSAPSEVGYLSALSQEAPRVPKTKKISITKKVKNNVKKDIKYAK